MIRLTLPYPISANRYWKSFPLGKRVMTAPSQEAKAYKSQVAWLVKEAGVREPIRGRVAIEVDLYPQRPQDWQRRAQRNPAHWDDDVRCIDLDNANKVLLDAIKGRLIEDDRWVWRLTGQRMEPDGEARVVVTVRPVQVQTPQPMLFEAHDVPAAA